MGIMKNKKFYLYAGLLGLIVICVNLPFDLELAPERKLQVVSSDGHPLPGVLVRQIWDQYSLGKSWEVDVRTNDKGEASLQRRIVRTNILSLIQGAMIQIRKYGVHASFWSDETILIFAEGYPPHIFFDGKGLKGGRAVIRKGPLDRTVIGSEK